VDARTPSGRPDRGDAPISALEHQAWAQGRAVVGIDEVGRGALAGPVTVAAVVLDPSGLPEGARDSKRLAPARRTRVAAAVHGSARVGLGSASNVEIDTVGLAAALTEAVRRAFAAVMEVSGAPEDPLVLVDGPHDLLRLGGVEVATIVRGDSASVSIAAASVVAKVDRDEMMGEMDRDHPAYGFARNRGYASPEHLAALARLGPCALHRLTWAPVARLVQPTLDV